MAPECDFNNFFATGSCEGQKVVDGETMPLVLEPADPAKNDVVSLAAALREDKEWFDGLITKHSAVLLRGFDVGNAVSFNDVVEAFEWADIRYVGPAPRTHVHKRVWTANEGPLSDFIYFHHEMVLMKEFPKKVVLFCEVPPPEGGETPFVPSFKVTEKMVEEFPAEVEEIEKRGLKYTFCAPGRNNSTSMRGRGWEDAFATADKQLAQIRARALGMEIEWLEDGGAKTILGPRPLTRVFEGRKERRMWFNTIVGMHGKEQSSATMEDGTELPLKFVKRCEEIIEEESIQFKWQKGDVAFFDNWALLHGRRPSLPPRKVLVATCK
ncbi:unnamed protein product [Linum tenue]|uniref:TauD/TfdA-like domain-containing protein n=1 Tax=Linum tenue TaxID=586396 RepID=A0AAV0R861_9ROSI|nr:unnamed protein product [Linum tenue]